MKWIDQIETPTNSLVSSSVRDAIVEEINKIKITWLSKAILWVWPIMFVLTAFVSGIYGALAISSGKFNWIILVSLIVISIVISVGLVIFENNIIKKRIASKINVVELINDALNNIDNLTLTEYQDFAVSKSVNAPIRDRSIPENAKYNENKSWRLEGKINGQTFELVNSSWMWEAVTLGQTIFNEQNICGLIVANTKCNEYNVSLVDNNSLLPGVKNHMQNLENDDFNKMFSLYGDPIKVRKMFNATEQEKFVQMNKIFNKFEIHIGNNLFIMTFIKPNKLLEVKIKMKFGRIKYSNIIDQVDKYTIVLLNILSNYSILRKIN